MKKLKIGLDVHGVIDRLPEVFGPLTQALVAQGHEVHILTGPHKTPEFEKQLRDLGVVWTHFLSIADYHTEQGNSVVYDDKGDPWVDKDLWDRTKGEYCLREGIQLHIDDSDSYGQHFETPYAKLSSPKTKAAVLAKVD